MTQPKSLPDPLVPADVDLRGLEYMPLFGNHLFGSEFNSGCSDAEWRAGVTLWWASWNQVPAASLPNNDTALARLADLGRDVKGWRKVKQRALHGFVECLDGRLYHRFLSKQALVAWEKRVKEREKKRRWREGKDGPGDRDNSKKGPGPNGGHGGGQARDRNGDSGGDGTADVTRRDGTGRDVSSKTVSASTTSPAVEIAVALRAQGVIDAHGMHPTVLGWAEAGVTVAMAAEAVRIAREVRGKAQPKVGYLVGIISDMQQPSKPSNGHAHPAMPLDWWATADGIKAKAGELGIEYRDPIATKCRIAARLGDGPWVDHRNATELRLIEQFRAETTS
jgi:hypothetical protein